MKFGVLYIPDYYEERHKSSSHYYGEMLEQIDLCEEIGLDKGDGLMFGTPERCIQRIKNIKAGLGITHMLFEVNFGGMAHDKVLRSLERFGKYVLPHVRDI